MNTTRFLTGALAVLILAACSQSPDFEWRPYTAIDGDTIRVGGGGPNIRLARIDAPELPGHCRRGRRCASGDPYASKAALQALLDAGLLVCENVDRDFYRRRLAECSVNGRNLSDAMLSAGHAQLYRRR